MPPSTSDERPFDVIPFEVSLYLTMLNSTVLKLYYRIYRANGRNWALDLSEMYIKVTGILDENDLAAELQLGSYLGIDVAIKEVLPSNEYDVGKYFEREWRLMK